MKRAEFSLITLVRFYPHLVNKNLPTQIFKITFFKVSCVQQQCVHRTTFLLDIKTGGIRTSRYEWSKNISRNALTG